MPVDFDLPPDAVLITGPVGGGKTEAALDEIIQAREFSAFGTIWVLLATGQQIYAFQQRLLARSPDAVQFGVEFFNFEALYARLLDLLGDPQRMVDDTARYQILRRVIGDLQAREELALFGEIAATPGFVGLSANLIHELKQGLILPQRFCDVADRRGPKDRDLARLYVGYQQFLQDRHLVDRHGAGWVAVDHLERGDRPPLDVDLLVVDGFDQFNQVHIRLLTALARQVKRTVLTLTEVPGEVGRRFRRFEQTRAHLLAASGDRPLWRPTPLRAAPAAARGRVLDHLSATLFSTHPDPLPGDESLTLIEAPDVQREVSAVLRGVKRRLLAGASPESVLVVTRDLSRYSPALRETARAYGIPLVVREGLPLRENPAVAQLLQLIDLADLDYPRREVLDTLRSPYLTPPDLSRAQIAALERISLDRRVVQGRDVWLDELRAVAAPLVDEDGEEVGTAAPGEALDQALAAFFARITPPPSGTVYDLAHWIEALIGPDPEAAALDGAENDPASVGALLAAPGASHFNLLGNLRSSGEGERVTRDLMALHQFRRVLAGLCAAHDLVTEESVLDWRDFRAELQMVVDRQQIIPPGGLSRLGRVLATNVFEARGLPHDHVCVLGLSEGIFPAQEAEDALYQDSERIALEQAGIDLQSAAEQDDMSLFYQVIGLARRTLTLSRFTVDDRGALNPASPYWHAVLAVVDVPDDAVIHVKTGAAPTLDEAATPDEAAVALAAVFGGEQAVGDVPPEAVYNALLDRWPDPWRGVLRGRQIEARREDPAQPFDLYNGLLDDPALRGEVARQLGPDRRWSASQFNEYGQCPFRFFAKRLLRLEELKEPEEGLDQLQWGLVNHAILEETYRQLAAAGLDIAPEHLDRALEILDDVAARVLADAPRRYQFRASPVWDHEQVELRRRLRWLIAQDFAIGLHPADKTPGPVAAQIAGSVRTPFAQEIAFGRGDLPPLRIDGPAGALKARGVIDRIDRAGDDLVLIDYKTGTAPHPVEDMAAGRDVQMALYLLAARELVRRDPALRVAGGMFWHIRNRSFSGEVLADDPAVDEARARIHDNILAARSGYFAVQPSKPGVVCANYCEFRHLCRLTRADYRKSAGGGA